MTRKTKRSYLPATCFVQVWQAYPTLDDVLAITRFKRQYALRRARIYRGVGIPLKRHDGEAPLCNNTLNVSFLARDAREFAR